MIEAAGGAFIVSLRFLVLSATTGALGAWAFDRFVLGRLAGDAGRQHVASLRHLSTRVAIACTVILVLAFVPQLRVHAASMRPPGGAIWPSLLSTLGSGWGVALAAQLLSASTVAALLVTNRRAKKWPALAEVGVAGLALVPALMGHAGAAHDWRAAAVFVDATHVVAAGGWIGALVLLTAAVVRVRHSEDGPALSAALIVAFHPVAMVTAGAVFVTGLGTAWLRMGIPLGIASSTYSGLFVAKLLLAGVTGAVGAGHSKLATRRVQAVNIRSTSRSLLGECALAVLVLVVTAILSGTEPIG